MDLRSTVEERLRAGGAPEEAVDLWMELLDAFEDGGPTAVKKAVEGRVSAALASIGREDPGDERVRAEE